MTLPIPFPVYGYVYNSNGDKLTDVTITAESLTNPQGSETGTSDANGVYYIPLTDICNDGDTIQVSGDYKGEDLITTFVLDVGTAGEELDINLEESMNSGDIYINTHRDYGNELYIWTPNVEESHMKTSDY